MPLPGLSIVIPERDRPDLLAACLESVFAALDAVSEAAEVIVVVNGTGPDGYRALTARWPQVRWVHVEACIWYEGAVREGLARARHDWVYLLNSDMVVDGAALGELLAWRAPHVFAIASQVFFVDPARRREETGWTGFHFRDGVIDIFDALPEDEETVRGTLYAGGGASLFQKALLTQAMGPPSPYRPFYWEDVEWGVRAWRSGYETFFCPRSRVWHHHRATNRRFFAEDEIERIFDRNRCLFQLRNPLPGESLTGLALRLLTLPRRSLREICAPRTVLGALRARLQSHLAPRAGTALAHVRDKYFMRPLRPGAEQPVVLVVTPYNVYPPAHGGAVRLRHLLAHLGADHQIVLLSDEAEAYTEASRPYLAPLAAVHLVSGRRARARGADRIARIREHGHRALAEELDALVARYRPAIVQVEFVELSALVRWRRPGPPWLLTLHDVLLEPGAAARADRFELALARRYDGLIVCSPEDGALLPGPSTVVPNGAVVDPARYVPSPAAPAILFVGSFRYPPNLDGITAFLEGSFPRVRARVPGAEIVVVGGHGARELADGRACFGQPGVRLIDFVEDPRPFLDQTALTINPLRSGRGSCVKVLESLAAGRVCVSTRDGARGFLDLGLGGLVIVRTLEDLAETMSRLLLDDGARRELERLTLADIDRLSWARSAELMAAIYRGRLSGGSCAEHGRGA
jgi:GT2 family glycosyltransferase/glycosyltransferase involved in cell wall biosynthesis